MRIKYLLLNLWFMSCSLLANPDTFSILCPSPDSVKIVAGKGRLNYAAHTFIDLPELNYQLEMVGEGSAMPPKVLRAATWTDNTFLCIYNNNNIDVVVMYELVLAQYVNRCYFKNTRHYAECENPDPKLCPLICERKSQNDENE